MIEQPVINPPAQDHAAACALFARRRGQRAPPVRRLPVLPNNLDEPTSGMGRDTLPRTPTESRRDPMARRLFACVWPRPDNAVGVVGTAVQARPADEGDDRFPTAATEVLGGPGMGSTIVSDVLFALGPADGLMTAPLTDHLPPPQLAEAASTKVEGSSRASATTPGTWRVGWGAVHGSNQRRARSCWVGYGGLAGGLGGRGLGGGPCGLRGRSC